MRVKDSLGPNRMGDRLLGEGNGVNNTEGPTDGNTHPRLRIAYEREPDGMRETVRLFF